VLNEVVRWVVIGVVVLVAAVQLVPYGRAHTNPPVRREPAWDAPQTRELAVRACFDCHSNQTVWPWYSTIAPISWLIQRDVDEGRRKTNFSEWDRAQKEAHESAKTVQKATMPPWYYPWAKLSPAERQTLIRGLEATLGTKGQGQGEKEQKQEQENRG
jgi:mono/diheme cytochrome c family protein